MKKTIAILLAALLTVSLFGCAKKEKKQEKTKEEAVRFTVETKMMQEEETSGDGAVLLTAQYAIPQISVSQGSAAVKKNADAFNREAEEEYAEWRGELDEWKADARTVYSEGGDFFAAYEFETSFTPYCTDRLVSICFTAYTYTGGAHPNSAFECENFDLQTGEFFDAEDLAADEDAFETAVADEILRQIDADGMGEQYFEGYEQSVRELEDVEICFTEEGMVVCFSDYQLGPHAAGIPTFLISYELIAPCLSEEGRTILGI